MNSEGPDAARGTNPAFGLLGAIRAPVETGMPTASAHFLPLVLALLAPVGDPGVSFAAEEPLAAPAGELVPADPPVAEAAAPVDPPRSQPVRRAAKKPAVRVRSAPKTPAPLPPDVLDAAREGQGSAHPRSSGPSWIVEPEPVTGTVGPGLYGGYPSPSVNPPSFSPSSVNPMARIWGVFLVSVASLLGLLIVPRTRQFLLSGIGNRLGGFGGQGGLPGGLGIQLAADKNLGMGQRVVAIEVDGRKVLLGLSQGRMEVLHTWEPEAPPRTVPAFHPAAPAVVRRSTSARSPMAPPVPGAGPTVRRVTEVMRPVAPSPAERRAGQTTSYVEPRQVTQGRARVPVAGHAPGAAPRRSSTHSGSAASLTPSAERLLDVWRQASMPVTPRPVSQSTRVPPPMAEAAPWWLDGATDGEHQRMQNDPVLPPLPTSSDPDDIESELQDLLTVRRRGGSRLVL